MARRVYTIRPAGAQFWIYDCSVSLPHAAVRACSRVIHRTYAVALSNVALPAAAWYFPTVVRFLRSASEKKNNKNKIKYRSAEG
jgi:hypothetical protein